MAAALGSKIVLFVEDAQVDYLDGEGLRKYSEGEQHQLRADKADRWIRRNKAVEVRVASLPPAAAPAAPAAPAPATPAPAAPAAPTEPPSGNTLAGAPPVAGPDGGGAGERPVALGGRGRGSPRL